MAEISLNDLFLTYYLRKPVQEYLEIILKYNDIPGNKSGNEGK
jgi:hypothetical protein